MTTREEDIVTGILRAVCDRVPALPSNTIIEIEQLTCRTWGGKRTYVARYVERRRVKRPLDVSP